MHIFQAYQLVTTRDLYIIPCMKETLYPIKPVILGKCSMLSVLYLENANWKWSSNNIIVTFQYNVIIFLFLLWMLATVTIVYTIILVTWAIFHVWIPPDGTSMIAHVLRRCRTLRHFMKCLRWIKEGGIWNKRRYLVPKTAKWFTYTGLNLLQESKNKTHFFQAFCSQQNLILGQYIYSCLCAYIIQTQ
jgi:hypothetical protein